MNVFRYMTITLILIALFHNKVVAEDETEMWAEPDMSIGNIKLGSSYHDIINRLGVPQEFGGTNLYPGLRYKDVVIELDNLNAIKNAVKNQLEWKPNIKDSNTLRIVAFQSVKTRGGLKIGSSLTEVLNVFGGTSYRIDTATIAYQSCTTIDIHKYPESNPFSFLINSFSGYALALHYDTEGISFYFKIDNKNSLPTVFAIAVSKKTACKNITNPLFPTSG